MRTLKVRQDHAHYQLQTQRDVWVATADHRGRPHLVPFSLDWDGTRVVAATPSASITVRNIKASELARLAVGDTRDVLLLDVQVKLVPVTEADPQVSEHFNARNQWDPRTATGDWVYLVMTPVSVQAWQSEEELEGRMLMRDGHWL
ncbi:MAG TPA: pyridoxamine 5'-phosphate oxidase family protein [Candidatus Saccharimonadia bacterium]|jgi:predicted pyridoxine 5'-phosphate oxidase superfamily flavin-nucleotide-binding protein